MRKILNLLPEYSEEVILEELKRIAKQRHKNTVTKYDLKNYRKVSYATILRKFPGGLSTALKKAGLKYREDHRFKTDDILLQELCKVWEEVLKNDGRRPYQNDLKKYGCKFSISTYKDRFGSWLKACQTLLDWEEGKFTTKTKNKIDSKESRKIAQRNRNIPLRLRIKILQRDKFKCVFCGRSPATHHRITLEIDHIHPF